MSASIVVLAAEKSEVPFYIAGGVLALWAVGISLYCLRSPGFPSGRAGQAVTILISAVLVAATAVAGVITAHSPSHASAATPPRAAATSQPATAPAASGSTTVNESADPSGALAYTKSVLRVPAGRVTIDFTNSSPVSHHLTVTSGGRLLGAPPTNQGGSHSLTLNLKPGRYQFYCSVPGHRQAGMHGTLVVG